MRKMLRNAAASALALIAACGSEGPTGPSVTYSVRVGSGETVFVKLDTTPAVVTYSSENCNQVLVVANSGDYQNGGKFVAPSGTLDLSSVQVGSTVTLYCIAADGKRVASASLSVVGPSSMKIDRLRTASFVSLNDKLKVTLLTQNVASCSYELGWATTGKEDPATVAPTFGDSSGNCSPVFAPGSTMPKGARSALLTVRATGSDGSGIVDTMTISLVVPKLQADSISVDSVRSGVWTVVQFFGHGKTYTSSNGVDFRGTVAGLTQLGAPVPTSADTSILITNVSDFVNADLFGIAVNAGGGVNWDYSDVVYIANDGRSEPAIGFKVRVVKP